MGWALLPRRCNRFRRFPNVRHCEQSHIRVSPPRRGLVAAVRCLRLGGAASHQCCTLILLAHAAVVRLCKVAYADHPGAICECVRQRQAIPGRIPPAGNTQPMRASPQSNRSIRQAPARRRPWPCSCSRPVQPGRYGAVAGALRSFGLWIGRVQGRIHLRSWQS